MPRALWKLLLAAPAALAASGLFCNGAFAAQEPNAETIAPVAIVGSSSTLVANEPPTAPVAPANLPAPALSQALTGSPSVADLDAPLPTSTTPTTMGHGC
jgi:hypothetical protein